MHALLYLVEDPRPNVDSRNASTLPRRHSKIQLCKGIYDH